MKYRCTDCDHEWDAPQSLLINTSKTSFPPCPECESEDVVWETQTRTGSTTMGDIILPNDVGAVSNQPLMEFGPLSHGRHV